MDHDYGLELTNNSKTSWAFSLPRSQTCIGATSLCKRLCYGNGVRYQTKGAVVKRQRNFRTIEFILSKDGPEVLAENLIDLIDRARPTDWLAARITGNKTKTPWTLRIHDLGDFHSRPYVKAWLLAAQQRPTCSFWFYTRSFSCEELFASMHELASLPNCKGWLSIDSENFEAGMLAYAKGNGVWNLALMQENLESIHPDLLPALTMQNVQNQVVSFPVHRGGHHAEPIQHPALITCPAVTGGYKLEPSSRNLRPCQSCNFCLP